MERIKLSSREKLELIKKLGGKCVYCGCNHLFLLELDHKVALISGGKDTSKNKQVTCSLCNQLKTDMSPKEFKLFLKSLNDLTYLNKLNTNFRMPKIILKPFGMMNPYLPSCVINKNNRLEEDNGN